jgi:hypothetical protein
VLLSFSNYLAKVIMGYDAKDHHFRDKTRTSVCLLQALILQGTHSNAGLPGWLFGSR